TIVVEDGMIERITFADQKEGLDNPDVIDVNGALVLPPFIEPHIHLDTKLTAGDPEWNKSGTLIEGIRRWRQRKESLTKDDGKQRARTVMKCKMGKRNK